MTRRDLAKARTRGKVIAAAKACFSARGYEAATIREIAKVAGMSTGAVFANFAGKAELYTAIYGHPPVSPERGAQLLASLGRLTDAARTSGGVAGADEGLGVACADAEALISQLRAA